MAAEVIKINESGVTMAIGSSRKLSVTILPSDGTEVVTWTSSNTSVATVNETGFVIGKSAGNVTITATLGTLTASCSVSVLANYTLVSIAEAKKRLSIDFNNQDEELQSRIDSVMSYITYATGIKACDFASLDTEIQKLAKEYVLSALYYDYYDQRTELNNARLTAIMKQLQIAGGIV